MSLLINSTIGFLVSEEAPTAIDAAFRIYMLPQGMFSVAVATVLFPALSRLATRRDLAGLRALIGSGMRQIALLLIPSAAAFVALATPIVRLVYERGEFDADSTAPGERGAVLVLVLAAVLRHHAAAHAQLLLAPAPVAADAARALVARSSTSSSRSRSTSRSGSAASCSARRSSNVVLTRARGAPRCGASSAGSSSTRTLRARR